MLGAATAAAAGTAGWYRSRIVETPPSVHYPGMQAGHALRDGAALPAPSATIQHNVAILGAGVAGLSCAWKLAREGFTDFVVVQGPEFAAMRRQASAMNWTTRWASHYLPLPSMASTHVREMLSDFGIIERGAGDVPDLRRSPARPFARKNDCCATGVKEEGLLPRGRAAGRTWRSITAF